MLCSAIYVRSVEPEIRIPASSRTQANNPKWLQYEPYETCVFVPSEILAESTATIHQVVNVLNFIVNRIQQHKVDFMTLVRRVG